VSTCGVALGAAVIAVTFLPIARMAKSFGAPFSACGEDSMAVTRVVRGGEATGESAYVDASKCPHPMLLY
jgi:hypothetical protein